MYGRSNILNVSSGRDLGLSDVEVRCPFCGQRNTVEVYTDKFGKWANGLQCAAYECVTNSETPKQSAELLITGIDSDCWDQFFSMEDEDENYE